MSCSVTVIGEAVYLRAPTLPVPVGIPGREACFARDAEDGDAMIFVAGDGFLVRAAAGVV